MTIADIKKIISNHNRYASNLMNTTHLTSTNTALTYKKFIDETPVISVFLKDIIEASVTAKELFNNDEWSTTITVSDNEEEMMSMYYKHLSYMATEVKDLSTYAFSKFFHEKKFDNAIKKLLSVAVAPLIQYIRLKLEELYLDIEEQEKSKITSTYIEGDVYNNSTVQKEIGGNATMRDVGNDKSSKHFNFQKESFFLGVVSSVVSALIVWGVTELIKYLIGG